MRTAVVVVAASLLVGCAANVPTKPKEPLAFDPKNPEITFRWLIQQAEPLRLSAKAASREAANNPLRKENHEIHQANVKRWKDFIGSLSGKEVVWPVEVRYIYTGGVVVDLIPKPFKENKTEVTVYFAKYPGNREHFSGNLLIGSSISLEEARALNQGSTLFVRGKIEEIDTSINGTDSDYLSDSIIIRINDTKAVLP